MANFKDYGLTGVANTVQLGKQGGTVSYDVLSGRYALKQSNTSIYAATDVGSITAFNGGVIINDSTQRFEIDGTTISRLAANVISLDGDAAVRIPVGNDAARPTGEVGMIRVNTEGNSKFEFYDGNTWSSVSTGGSNGQLQFNSNGSMGGISSTSYDGSKLTLGSNSEVGITGGEAGQMLTTDGSGNLIWSTPNPGTVTSVDFSGGDTGLVTVGGPITSNGTITLGGTLNVANGGTGTTTSTGTGSVVLSSSPTLITPNLGTPSSANLINATGLPATGITGVLSIANGGTGANTATAAFDALSPSQTGNVGKILTTDGTTTSWTSLGITNELFVSKGGNDSTGNGSITNPFLTISAALNYLNSNYPVTSGSGTPFVVVIGPGVYVENVTIDRLLTNLWGYEGKLKTTRISGTVTINSAVDFGGLFQNNVSLNNLFIAELNNPAVQWTGNQPMSLDVTNCVLYTSGTGTPLLVNNTAIGGNRLRVSQTDINAIGNAPAFNITNVTNGILTDITSSSAAISDSAGIFSNSVVTVNSLQLTTASAPSLVSITGSSSVVNIGYSAFNSSAANGSGINISTAGARAIIGDCFYNISLGTGYAVTGTAGAIYVRGGNQALPGTNNTVNPVLALTTFTMSTHVAASDLIGTVAIANGGTGANTKVSAFDALSPTSTTGDMIYFNGNTNVRLGIGTETQVLTVANGVPTWAPGGGGGGTPGGLDTQIQFNDAGTFGGTANLTFDETTSTFTIGGDTVSNTSITGGTITTATVSSQPDTNLALVPGANGIVTVAAENGGATGVELGTPAQGQLVSNAVALTTESTVSDAIAQLNQILGKLVPPSPPNFPAGQTLSINSLATYRMTNYVQTDNTASGGKSVAGGTTVTNVLRTASYTTSNITNAGPGDSGTVTAWVNGANTGSRTLTSSINGNGTYNNLVIFNNADYNTVNSSVSPGFWYVFSARASGTVTQGWNEVRIGHSTTANTNTPSWFYDSSSPGTPQFTSTSITANSVSLTYSSTVPHYNSSTSFAVQFNVNRLSGNTYPTTDTFVTGTAGGGFSAPTSVTYATAGVTTPLTPNLYVASGSHTVNTAASIISGFGSSSSGPSVSVNNSYATGSTSFSPGATVLYKTGTTSSASRIEETNIFVGSSFGVGSGLAFRIINPGSTNTPTFTANAPAFDSQTSTLETYDATVVANVLKHDVTNYSTGYLPAGPNLSSGRTGTQYFTFKIIRSSVSKFDIGFTGTVAGMWVALPGSTIDSSSTLNGWIDMSVAYAGAGAPGANIGAGGNGSNGCALGGPVPLNAAQSNRRFTCTFGTVSSSNTPTNEIYIRIALTSGQTITALTLQTASN